MLKPIKGQDYAAAPIAIQAVGGEGPDGFVLVAECFC